MKFIEVSQRLGVNQVPEDWAIAELVKFVINQFKDFSFSEILEACDLYSAMKLEFKESHFQNLSAKFIGSLLSSYRSYRNKALFKYHKELDRMESEKEPTEDEKKAIHEEYLKQILFLPYQKALKSDSESILIDYINALKLFWIVYTNGSLKVDESLSKSFRQKAIEEIAKPKGLSLNKKEVRAINELMGQIRELENGKPNKELDIKIKEKSAGMYFNHWLNEKLKNKEEIEKYFNE